jgi:hypothetical protein
VKTTTPNWRRAIAVGWWTWLLALYTPLAGSLVLNVARANAAEQTERQTYAIANDRLMAHLQRQIEAVTRALDHLLARHATSPQSFAPAPKAKRRLIVE